MRRSRSSSCRSASSPGPCVRGRALPAFAFPEPAAAVLGRSYLYGHWLATEAAAEVADSRDIDRSAAAATIAARAGRRTVDARCLRRRGGPPGVRDQHARHAARSGGQRGRDGRRHRLSGRREGRAPPPRTIGPRRSRSRSRWARRRRRGREGDAGRHRRRRRRRAGPADGRARPRPAHPQRHRRRARSGDLDRARQLDRRPRGRRGVSTGAAVVGGRVGAARRLTCRRRRSSTPNCRSSPWSTR